MTPKTDSVAVLREVVAEMRYVLGRSDIDSLLEDWADRLDAAISARPVTDALPALPIPAAQWQHDLPLADGGVVNAATYYTAEQMRAYALAARTPPATAGKG